MKRHKPADEPAIFSKSGIPWLIVLAGLCAAPAAHAASGAAPPEAASVAQPGPDKSVALVESHVLRGKAAWDGRDGVAALKAFDEALALDPHHVPAREGRLIALARMTSPADALAEAVQFPEIGAGVLQYLHEEEAALAIRWSENVYHAKASDHFPDADRAIALAQENLRRYPGSLRSRFDLVRALNNRQRSADAIAAYEALQRDGLTMPAYVHEAAGSAYFASRQAALSAQAYRTALAADPQSLEANVGLFYALSDQNEFAAAQIHIDAYAAQPKKPVAQFLATTAAIEERAFENRLEIAQSNFLALQAEAPHSTELHVALGRVYFWRGWPRRAKEELELAMQRAPDDSRANNALIEVDMALGDYRAASSRLAQAQAATPDDHDAANLVRAEAVRNMHALSVSVSGTRSNDNLGSGDGQIVESRLYAKPLGYQTRPFVHAYYEHATINEITADYQRLGVGLEHVIAGVGTVEAEVQQEFYLNNDSSLVLGGTFDLNDQWQFMARADSNAIEVPLRARYDEISGSIAELGLAYRANERIAASVNAGELQMSDNNLRQTMSLTAMTKVVQGPVYNATLGVELSVSRNSLENTAYFNPKSDHTEQISYTSEWLNYQRYDRSFKQTLVLSIGRYTEEGFATGAISSVSYQHDVQASDVVNLSYGVGYVSRLYSGVESFGPEANLSFTWKF